VHHLDGHQLLDEPIDRPRGGLLQLQMSGRHAIEGWPTFNK
jgi:hypothetical protein